MPDETSPVMATAALSLAQIYVDTNEAAKAVALRECLQPSYRDYAGQVVANAQALATGLAAEGMRAVSGGTDTHLALIDLREVGVTGKEAEHREERSLNDADAGAHEHPSSGDPRMAKLRDLKLD